MNPHEWDPRGRSLDRVWNREGAAPAQQDSPGLGVFGARIGGPGIFRSSAVDRGG